MSNNIVGAEVYEEKRKNKNKDLLLSRIESFWNYDTSSVEYVNMYEPFTLICPEHGAFETSGESINKRLKRSNNEPCLPLCPECLKELSKDNNLSPKILYRINQILNSKKPHYTEKDTRNFIEKAQRIHGDKYDYSLTEYKGAHQKIKFKCKSCGDILEQQACDHLRTKGGCRKCGEKESHKDRKISEDQFWKKVLELKNENKWDLDFTESIYKGMDYPITYKCKKHGEITKKADLLYKGHGCRKCSAELQGKQHAKTTRQFIEDAKKVHGEYYDYSEVNYTSAFTKVKIIDPTYGPFWMSPNSHLNGQGFGKLSNGEKVIRSYLLNHGIPFEKEKTFPDLKSDNNYLLRFDFYLPKYNLCIEYQGEQHYRPVALFGGEKEFKKLQKNDKKKKEWCEMPSHPDLLTIGYREKIIEKLESYLVERARLAPMINTF